MNLKRHLTKSGAWSKERWTQLFAKNLSRPLPFVIGVLWGTGRFMDGFWVFLVYTAMTVYADLYFWVSVDMSGAETRERLEARLDTKD